MATIMKAVDLGPPLKPGRGGQPRHIMRNAGEKTVDRMVEQYIGANETLNGANSFSF